MSGNSNDEPTGLNQTLHHRVLDQIAIVKDALDDALANPTDPALHKLSEATDNLMRSLARVLLEIERQRSTQ